MKLPTNEVFVQTCYNNAAKDLYRDPYIYHETQNEHARNDKLYERFCACIETTVKELIPVQQILQTYMSQTQEGQDLDLDEAEVGDSEDPDLIDGYEEETSEEPFDAEPPMGQSMEAPMEEQSTEAPMEQSMEPPMEQVMQPEQSSPFDNEFKTINTKQQQQPYPQQPEEEGVLFPDASETRAKKVGYY